jgi:hypothetical protein
VDDGSADRIELQDQITQLLIENPLSVDEFLNPEDETIVDEDKDILVSVVNHYAITRPCEEEESSDEEEVKEVDIAETLRAVETVKMWRLQTGNNQDLQALDRLAREIASSQLDQQMTIAGAESASLTWSFRYRSGLHRMSRRKSQKCWPDLHSRNLNSPPT